MLQEYQWLLLLSIIIIIIIIIIFIIIIIIITINHLKHFPFTRQFQNIKGCLF